MPPPARAREGTIEPYVFAPAAVVVAALCAFGIAAPALAQRWFFALQDAIVGRFGWLFTFGTAVFLVFAVWAGLGARGRLRLARDDAPAEFGLASWFAMLFSAGMGIGIMFFGVAEPVLHYANPPDAALGGRAAAERAIEIAFFHWGLHAWGVYAVMGLAIAWFGHREGLPLSVRSTLAPLIGDRIHGGVGHAVDVLAVFGTLFGLATSLGLGAMQVNAGLARLFGIPQTVGVQIALIAFITACATTSLVLGLDKGIRRLSNVNIALAALLLAFVLFAGPTGEVAAQLPARIARYAMDLVPFSLGLSVPGDLAWRKSWTLFYWAWWIAWAPFVGTFIARISRGRTVREFVFGVLLVPTVVSLVWFGVFGGTALALELRGGGIAALVESDIAIGIYGVLERLPFTSVSSLLAVLVVTVFFVTSSDSGSFVVDMLTSGGHPDPPVWQRIFWASAEGVVAAVLLFGGGLAALQSAAINTGLPFCLVLLAVCAGLGRALWHAQAEPESPPRPVVDAARTTEPH